jgi:hypothetical protein
MKRSDEVPQGYCCERIRRVCGSFVAFQCFEDLNGEARGFICLILPCSLLFVLSS